MLVLKSLKEYNSVSLMTNVTIDFNLHNVFESVHVTRYNIYMCSGLNIHVL